MLAEDLKEHPSRLALKGLEVAITGRFASLTQKQVGELILESGGRFVKYPAHSTRLLIIGQGGLPLESDAHPSKALETAQQIRVTGGALEILTEEAFLERLGLDRGQQGFHGRYTIVRLSQILKRPGDRIRSWIKAGLLEPAEVLNRVPLFSFQQVAAARSLCDLVEAGLSPAEIRKGLDQLQQLIPDLANPLLQVSTLESSKRLMVRLESGQLAEPSGQLHLDFEADDEGEDLPLSFLAVSRSPAEIFAEATQCEMEGLWEQAVELYRQVCDVNSRNPIPFFNLGNVLYRQNQPEAAAEEFRQALRINPGYIAAWNNLGSMLLEMGRVDEAVVAFQQALTLAPGSPDVRANLTAARDISRRR